MYKKNFLKNVIFRIDFAPIYKIDESPSQFQEKIKEFFPKSEEQIGGELTIEIEKLPKQHSNIQFPVWVFTDENKTYKIHLTRNFLTFECSNYTQFSNFYNCYSNIYNNFVKIYEPKTLNRIGLRYINNLKLNEGNPLDWNGYINSNLLLHVENFFKDEMQNLSRAITQVTLNYDDLKVIFSYGWLNSEYPNKISRREFLLDFDCSNNAVDSNDVLKNLSSFHEILNQKFEKSIESKLRDLLNKE